MTDSPPPVDTHHHKHFLHVWFVCVFSAVLRNQSVTWLPRTKFPRKRIRAVRPARQKPGMSRRIQSRKCSSWQHGSRGVSSGGAAWQPTCELCSHWVLTCLSSDKCLLVRVWLSHCRGQRSHCSKRATEACLLLRSFKACSPRGVGFSEIHQSR